MRFSNIASSIPKIPWCAAPCSRLTRGCAKKLSSPSYSAVHARVNQFYHSMALIAPGMRQRRLSGYTNQPDKDWSKKTSRDPHAYHVVSIRRPYWYFSGSKLEQSMRFEGMKWFTYTPMSLWFLNQFHLIPFSDKCIPHKQHLPKIWIDLGESISAPPHRQKTSLSRSRFNPLCQTPERIGDPSLNMLQR